MKKLVCSILSIFSLHSVAQVNSVVFDQKLTYRIKLENVEENYLLDYLNIKYEHLIGSNKHESLLSFFYTEKQGNSTEANLFIKNGWMIPITINGISKTVSYSPYSAFPILKSGQILSKIDKKGSFNDIDCEYYAFLSDKIDKNSYEVCFCIDEKNPVDNASYLFPESNIKGLIVSAENRSDESIQLIFNSMEAIQVDLDFNSDKMMAAIDNQSGSRALEEFMNQIDFEDEAIATQNWDSTQLAIYSDPLFTSGSLDSENEVLYQFTYPIYSITSNLLFETEEYSENANYNRGQLIKFYKKASKSLVKNLKASQLVSSEQQQSLNNFFKAKIKEIEAYTPEKIEFSDQKNYLEIDRNTDSLSVYSFYTPYESTYKNHIVNEVTLAYDGLDSESLKVNAPDYCDDLRNKIPDFQNKELKLHVYNLAGQICDLYLYNNGGYVGYFETINSMRKSFLEIEKMRNSLSKKDQKALLEYLISLD